MQKSIFAPEYVLQYNWFMLIQTTILLILVGLVTVMTVKLVRAIRRFRIKKPYTAAIDAPSVSVCIAARNETHALAECLQRVLASDYAKLEVIVYDDTSEDDTSMIVKSFAHAGVRFVEGSQLPSGWLGRNYACDTLAREASGTFLVMMSVDTYIKPTTISQLVGYMLTEKMQMISVIPGRSATWRWSVLFGHLYYYWQILLSRSSHPAAAEALWMIQRKTLVEEIGGLEMLKDKVLIGLSLARVFGATNYHCLINNSQLGVSFEKKLSSQKDMSVRELYPLAGNNLPGSIFALLGLIILTYAPFGALLALLTSHFVLAAFYLAVTFWIATLYGFYTRHIWQKWSWIGGLVWEYVVFQEMVLMMISMSHHLQKRVIWKGRSIYDK